MTIIAARAWAALALLVSLSAIPAQASPVTTSPQPWVVSADGSDQRRLSEDDVQTFYAPSWSPDGTRVAFDSNVGVLILDPDTGERTVLEGLSQPHWSPVGDDEVVGATFDNHGHGSLYTASVSTEEMTPVVTDLPAQQPVWSPDGTQIAFVSGTGSGEPAQLYVVDNDGSDVHRVSDTDALYTRPEWSPDGERIAFASWDHGLYVAEADGSGQYRLDVPTDATRLFDPDWSPDGTEIATGDGWIFAVDGSSARTVPGGNDPDWSPDGTAIAYSHATRIYVVNADGSGQRALTSADDPEGQQTSDSGPVWSPDGSRLVFGRSITYGWPPPGYVYATIRYDQAGRDAFRGSVGSDRVVCTEGVLVRVHRVRRDGSVVIGRDRTNRRGNWRVHHRAARGRYYAVVRSHVETATDGTQTTCGRAQSPTIRI